MKHDHAAHLRAEVVSSFREVLAKNPKLNDLMKQLEIAMPMAFRELGLTYTVNTLNTMVEFTRLRHAIMEIIKARGTSEELADSQFTIFLMLFCDNLQKKNQDLLPKF